MEHQEAIDNYAAEGYLLDELTDAERHAFEEHFADCDTCFADVRDGLRFAAPLPDVVSVPVPAQRPWRELFAPLAAAAGVAIVMTGGIQQLAVVAPLRAQLANERAQLAKEREPHIVPAYTVVLDARAAQEPLTVNGASPFQFTFDIPPDLPPPYRCAIVDAHGKTRFSVPVTAAQARHTVNLQVPGGLLAAGNDSLVITGAGGVSVSPVEFTVQ